MTDSEMLHNYASKIADHLQSALVLAQQMQKLTLDSEGDSDLHRKLAFYLVPNLNHWIVGAQAGNIKDLSELFTRRDITQEPVVQTHSNLVDRHSILKGAIT